MMRFFRRSVQVGALAMLALAAVCVAMASVSPLGVSWSSAGRSGFDLINGRLSVRYRGAAGRMTAVPPGWAIGRSAPRSVGVSGGGAWLSHHEHSWWVGSASILRGGPMPLPASPGGGSVLAVFIHISLVPTAVIAGVFGGVL